MWRGFKFPGIISATKFQQSLCALRWIKNTNHALLGLVYANRSLCCAQHALIQTTWAQNTVDPLFVWVQLTATLSRGRTSVSEKRYQNALNNLMSATAIFGKNRPHNAPHNNTRQQCSSWKIRNVVHNDEWINYREQWVKQKRSWRESEKKIWHCRMLYQSVQISILNTCISTNHITKIQSNCNETATPQTRGATCLTWPYFIVQRYFTNSCPVVGNW